MMVVVLVAGKVVMKVENLVDMLVLLTVVQKAEMTVVMKAGWKVGTKVVMMADNSVDMLALLMVVMKVEMMVV